MPKHDPKIHVGTWIVDPHGENHFCQEFIERQGPKGDFIYWWRCNGCKTGRFYMGLHSLRNRKRVRLCEGCKRKQESAKAMERQRRHREITKERLKKAKDRKDKTRMVSAVIGMTAGGSVDSKLRGEWRDYSEEEYEKKLEELRKQYEQ